MTWLFQEIVDWLVEIVGELFKGISVDILTIFSLDLTYFEENVPFIVDIVPILKGFAFGLAFLFFIIAVVKNLAGGMNDEYESIVGLFFGLFLSCLAIGFSQQIIQMEFDLFTTTYDKLMDIDVGHSGGLAASNVIGDGVLNDFLNAGKGVGIAIISLFLLIVVVIEFFKLLIECVERYIIVALCMYFSPLGMSTFVSKNSRKIGIAYLKLTFSQLLMMLMNVIFVKATLSAMQSAGDNDHAVLGVIFIVGIVETAQAIDRYMGKLGLTAVDTGRGLGAAVMTGMIGASLAVSRIPKAIGGMATGGAAIMNKMAQNPNLDPARKADLLSSAKKLNDFGEMLGARNPFNEKTLAREVDAFMSGNGNDVPAKFAAGIANGHKRGDIQNVLSAMNKNPLSTLQSMSAGDRQNGNSVFDKVRGMDGAEDLSIGTGKMHGYVNGEGVSMRKLREGEAMPENATGFKLDGEDWCATADNPNHGCINTDESLNWGSMQEVFGPQAGEMAADCGHSVGDEVTRTGDGVYSFENGDVLKNVNKCNAVGGKQISGMDGYALFSEADVQATPFAQNGYSASDGGGIGNDYISANSYNDSFNSAMRNLGVRDDFTVTSISHGNDGEMPNTISFTTNTGGEFMQLDASQYEPINSKGVQMVSYGANGENSYYVCKASDVSNFRPSGGVSQSVNRGESGEVNMQEGVLPNGKFASRVNYAGDLHGEK